MDHRIRPRAETAVLAKEIPLDLLPLLSSFGRDRRVALRIERLPTRGRLSRGRNNGDGSWSVTRDELDGLTYIPPKSGNQTPMLVVRVIGLEGDNGATLAVLDYQVEADDVAESDSDDPARRDAELRQLRAELAKAKSAMRASQSELSAARQLWEAELEERVAEAQSEAQAKLERNLAEWQGQVKERTVKSDARVEQRLAQAREGWRRESEIELAKAETAWKDAEAERLAAAESRWREQSQRTLEKERTELKRIRETLAAARANAEREDDNELRRLREEVDTLRSDLAQRETNLAEARNAAKETRDRARIATQAVLSNAEQVWKSGEAARLAAAETRWQEQSSLVLAEMARRLEQAESAVVDARAASGRTQERPDTVALQKLNDELAAARATLKDRDQQLAEWQSAGGNARNRGEKETHAALARASAQWKTEEETRTAAAKAEWQKKSARDAAELTAKIEATEAAFAEAKAEWQKKSARDTSELAGKVEANEAAFAAAKAEWQKKAARDIAALSAKLETTESEFTAAKAEWQKKSARELAALSARLEATENDFAAAKAEWQKKSARDIATLTAKIETNERALAAARAEASTGHERRETADVRHLKNALHDLQSAFEAREVDLKAAHAAATEASERAKMEIETALARAEKEWEARETTRFAEAKTQWQEQSELILKKARLKLEGADAALAEARATANSAQDLREGTELRRLRTEFAAARAKVTELESELAAVQLASGRDRERTREELESTLAKAEEAWKTSEAVRTASIETQERERGARAVAEVTARLERAETALKEARRQTEGERERASVALAEMLTRYERSESQLKNAQTRIESMRDPMNETELDRLRTELAEIQVSYTELEGEIARSRAENRKMRERATEQSKAAVMRAEEAWRIDEATRLAAARREWERDAKFGAVRIDATMDEPVEQEPVRRANRLLLDSALAVGLAAVVVLIVTFSPSLPDLWPSTSRASGTEIPKAVTAVSPKFPRIAAPPRAIIGVAAANLRAAPAVSAEVIVRLRRGDLVAPGERQGDWTRVHADGAAGKPPHDGWIYTASLKPAPAH